MAAILLDITPRESVTLIDNISYRPFTQTATAWRWGNGTTHSRTIDADGRVGTVSLGSLQRSYAYDAAGRVSAYSDLGGQGTVLSSFGYDEAGQLISYSGPAGSFSYTYDSNGNRRTAVRNGTTGNLTYAAGTNPRVRHGIANLVRSATARPIESTT